MRKSLREQWLLGDDTGVDASGDVSIVVAV